MDLLFRANHMPLHFLRRLEARHRAWRYRTKTDSAEIRWMRGALREGDVVIDAGAYKGGYTYWMRHAVGPSGHVLAFEPQSELVAFMNRGVEAFGWRNVDVARLALSSKEGDRILHIPGEGPSRRASLVWARPGAQQDPVPTCTLDAFLSEQRLERSVRFIKCDVEGHELEVFRGAEETLTRDHPTLLFECEARHDPSRSMSEVFGYLQGLGYKGSYFLAGHRLPLNEFDESQHQVPGRRPYANNFLFEAL